MRSAPSAYHLTWGLVLTLVLSYKLEAFPFKMFPTDKSYFIVTSPFLWKAGIR